MRIRLVLPILCILLVLGALSACVPEGLTSKTESPEAIYTSAAQTMAFELTLSAGGTAVAQLTEMSGEPTATFELPAISPIPTDTPTPPAPTPAPSTATSAPLPCGSASFGGDVSVQPLTVFSPGERFLKIWRLSNTSNCNWTPAYSLVFSGGNSLGGPLMVSLPKNVPPGESVDIGVELSAPTEPGDYQGFWLLRDPANDMVSIEPNPLGALWVQIRVQGTLSSFIEYDFAANYCAAEWRSDEGLLDCPGDSNSTDGSVILLDQPRLESRNEDELALWLRPNEGKGGWITGEYPPTRVRQGDHFISEIGCLRDSPQCELNFELNYRAENGHIENLDSWDESYDGETTRIDIDLSDLEGDTVQFILSVTNNDRYRDANGFWLVPHIHNEIGQNDLVISWRQEGGISGICNDVKVYLTGRRAGQARARTCGGDVRDSGNDRLSKADLEQILDWVDRFDSYQYEVDTPTSGGALKETITFEGEGTRQASYNDIRSMQEFMLRLFNTIIH